MQDRDGLERLGPQRGRHAQSSGAVSTDGPCGLPKATAALRHTRDRRRNSPCHALPPMPGLGGMPPAVRAQRMVAFRPGHEAGLFHALPLFGGSMGALFHSLAFFFSFALAVRFLAATLDATPGRPNDRLAPCPCYDGACSVESTIGNGHSSMGGVGRQGSRIG